MASGEVILNVGGDAGQEPAFVSRATDPVVSNFATPIDFAAQFPTPLDTTELIAMCDEINLWRSIPEEGTMLKEETWRELNELAFTSGTAYESFADGACPEEYYHDGDNTTVTLKNIGAKKTLGISDIMHSAAVAGANWNGINFLNGPFPASQGLPGGDPAASFLGGAVRDLKEKEMTLASILVLNAYDRILALGNKSSNSLEFDGIELQVTSGNGARADVSSASGTFSAGAFDRALGAGCAKPQVLLGHSTAIQELMSNYFQLGAAGLQVIHNNAPGNRITPGFNFSGEVLTGIGLLQTVADNRFTRSASSATTFQSKIFGLRMQHNGQKLVYRKTQIPLAFKDLMPGCTAISFQIWTKTALIIKAMCAQMYYQSLFTGVSVTTCPVIQ